jgi:hypothetical protein
MQLQFTCQQANLVAEKIGGSLKLRRRQPLQPDIAPGFAAYLCRDFWLSGIGKIDEMIKSPIDAPRANSVNYAISI